MHRALSTENLAYFAQSTLHSIRRIISSSSSSDEGDLASLTKHMEERCVGGFALDPVKSVAWVSLLQSELHALAHPPTVNCGGGRASISQKGGGGLTSSAASSGGGTSHAHKDPLGSSLSMSPRAGSGNNNNHNINTNGSDNADNADANQSVGASAAVARAASLPSSTDGTPVTTATGKPPVGSSANAPNTNNSKKRPNEATLLSALECVKLVYRIYSTDAIALFSEHRLFVTMAELLQTNSGTRKLYEALTNTLVAFSAERTSVFADLAETIIAAIETIPTPQSSFLTLVNDDYGSNAQQQGGVVVPLGSKGSAGKITSYALVPKMRLLLFVSNALKRADLVDIEHSNETKSLLVEMGAMSKILTVAEGMRGVVEHPASDENPQAALALGVLLMSVLAGLVRSNVPNKDELRKDAHVFELWTFFANHVGRMEGPFSYLLDGSDVHDHNHNHHTGFHMHSQVSSPTASTSNNTFMLGNAHRRQLSGSGIFGSAPSSTSNPNLAATPGPEGKDGLGSPQQGAAKGATACVYRIAEKLQVLTLEPPSVWASDLVEFLTELCTSDSFSLNRQSLYAAQDDAAGITSSSAKSEGLSDRGGRASPRAMAMGVAATATAKRHAAAVTVVGKATPTIGSSVTALDPFGGVRKWEVLPANWDAMVSDSLFIWRLVSAAAICTLTTETTCQLLRSICGLDMSAPYADFVFRAILSNLIILFRASPMNAEAIVEADTFRKIISTMTAPATVLVFQDIEKPRACVKLGQPNWAVCMALLTVIMHTSPRRCEVATLMRGVGDMATNETAAEDCEIIEHLLQVLASSTYPPGNTLWLSASSASVACPVERFAGRWYGYTYLGWVNPLCIWQGGSHLVSWADPSGPSSVVVTIVANGRKKCLSVCHTSGQESSVSLLTDSILTDGWTHIAIVHNISGFTVFINGQKRSCGNVPFPKEPSKPHRLCFHFGGSNGELGFKPFFGFMTQPQLMDGAVPDKDIERLAAAGAGSNASSVEPGLSILPLLTIDEQISGPLASTSASLASLSSLPLDNYMTGAGATPHQQCLRDVFVHKAPNMADILQSEGVLEWFLASITNASEYSNRNSVAILSLEMLIAYARLVPNGLSHIYEKGVLTAFSRDVLSWDSIPYHLPPVVVGLVQVGAESRRLFNHPISLQVLTFLADMIASPNCPPLTKNQIFRDLSSLLGEEHNRKLFKDGPSLTAILSVCSALQRECIDDCVILMEKLVRDNAEMDSVLKFLAFEKQQQLMRCDILRMLYEVGQSDAQILDALASANAVPILIYIIGDVSHQSENLRAYAIRLLALVLVMNRKQRDVFVRVGGFDTFAAAMSQKKSLSPIASVTSGPSSVNSPALALNASASPPSSSASPLSPVPLTNVILGAAASQLPYPPHAMPSYAYPLRLTTFNFLFKFALGFFQPMEFSKDGLSRSQQFAGTAPATRPPVATVKGQPISVAAMNGHLPSLIPRRDLSRRQISMDLASLHSDPDARLTIDDTYNSQSHSNKTELLHAQLLQTIFALLPFAVESSLASSSPSFVNANTIAATNGNSGRRHGTVAVRGSGAATHTANGGNSTHNPNSNSSSSMFAGTRRPSVGGGVEDVPTVGSSPASAQDTPPLAHVHSPTEMGPRGGSIVASAENSGQLPSSPHGSFNTGGNYNFNSNAGNIPITGRSADAVSECGSGSTTARRAEEEQYATVLKVLAFADRVFDINKNADIVLLHPWMEWLWCGVAPFFPEGGAVMMGVPASVAASVETYTRSIIRKICIADLVKSRSNSNIKRVKDLTEMPTMQRMVIEEVLRHFSTNNRLDVLQQEEATNVLRNLDSLLLGIDESISPFPLHLGLEVAHSLAAITVNNNAWVRTRVRSSTKLLETRDRLCFLLLSSGWQSFKRGPADRIAKVLQANAHDPNSTLLVLKYIVEAVADRDVESVEALQAMLQQLQTLDPEQRRALGRAAADDEVIKILLSPPPPPMTNVVSSEASGGGKSPTDTKNPTTKPGEGGAHAMGGAPVSSREGTPLSDQAATAAVASGQKATAAGSASLRLANEDVTGTAEGTTFIQWCISHVAKWEATAAKITKACKNLDESIRSQSEKSQREFAAKVKVRKGELERRAQQQYKSAGDYEKLCADVESKRASYTDAISLAHTKRKDRDEKRQSLAARTNSSAPSATTTGGGRTSSVASVNSRNVSIVTQ